MFKFKFQSLLIPGLVALALSASPLMARQYVTRQYLAKHFGITPRAVSNMISRGTLTGYQLPGLRAIRVDLNEAEALVKVMPTAFKPRKPFGPHARIVEVSQVEAETNGQTGAQVHDQNQAEAVTPGGDR